MNDNALNNFVTLVMDNVQDVNLGNALKLKQFISFSSDPTKDKYDLEEFFKAFISEAIKRAKYGEFLDSVYSYMVIETLKALNKLDKNKISKLQIFDEWIFNIRLITFSGDKYE